MSIIRFGIVGGGWRSEFFLRIAAMLPEKFEVTGVLVRNEEKGIAIEQRWGVPTFRNLYDLLATSPLFTVVSVPRNVAPEIIMQLAAENMPVLCETPPAETLEDLTALYEAVGKTARIQVAEQYPFQPNHAARLAIIQSGKLGDTSYAQVSSAHDYHGLVLMRRYLGIHFEEAIIRGIAFESTITEGPGRSGPPLQQRIVKSSQTIATFDFGGKVGMYDFTGDQYFSWIRSSRILIRGEKGEISDMNACWLADYSTPLEAQLIRLESGKDGNLEGFYLKGILCGGEYVYRNELAPGRLADDEIAIATCLERMSGYAKGTDKLGFYSLAEACQDQYLSMMMNQAIASGEAVRTTPQRWME